MSSYEKVIVCERLPLEKFLCERSPLDNVALPRGVGLGIRAATALAAPLMKITAANYLTESLDTKIGLLLGSK